VSLRSLQDLGDIREALKRAEREAAEREARAREEEARRLREANLFSHSVGRVQPMAPSGRRHAVPTPPSPEPRQRELDEERALHESLSDEFDPVTLLETDDQLSYRRPEIGIDVLRKLRRGGWSIQGEVDLHGLRRDAARERLTAFVHDAVHTGLRCVRVVHGKGNGSPGREPVLKGKVRSWLIQKADVLAFVQARGDEGGHGAVIVLLRALR
jgi:DNA-nicking Smr family endonuclease